MTLEVRESQIEDALAGAAGLARKILNLAEEPRLLARQMILPSGRLDLLYTHRNNLILVELKAVKFQRAFLRQILDYRDDLIKYQDQGQLLQGEIRPYLLCPETTSSAESAARNSGVVLSRYDPLSVLENFYKNFKPVAFFTGVKPVDLGIWNLHLINKFIRFVPEAKTVARLLQIVGGSGKTLFNKIKFASEMRLVNWKPNGSDIALTDLGRDYVAAEESGFAGRLSEKQADVLRRLVMQNPYESSVILGIASVVESVFILSKNTYPVQRKHLEEYFAYYAGKLFDWKSAKAKFSGTRMYSNYAVDLGLLAKTQETIYLTPEGMRFTLQMQMHKNMKMFESVRIS